MTSVDILGLGGVGNSQILTTFNNFPQSYIEVDSLRIILSFYFPFNGKDSKIDLVKNGLHSQLSLLTNDK